MNMIWIWCYRNFKCLRCLCACVDRYVYELTPVTLQPPRSPPYCAGRWTNHTSVQRKWEGRSKHSKQNLQTPPTKHTTKFIVYKQNTARDGGGGRVPYCPASVSVGNISSENPTHHEAQKHHLRKHRWIYFVQYIAKYIGNYLVHTPNLCKDYNVNTPLRQVPPASPQGAIHIWSQEKPQPAT